MRVSAKVDYALRALAELAAAPPGQPVKGEQLATRSQEIPLNFLENILLELRRSELVASRRGADGGYWLGRPAAEISLADVVRAVEGPIASVRGSRPEDVTYTGAATALQDVWIELRASMRGVLEEISLADLVERSNVTSPKTRSCCGRRYTIWFSSSSSSSQWSLVTCAHIFSPSARVSSIRTSKPRWTIRSIIASSAPSEG